jgi:hypothetical protein
VVAVVLVAVAFRRAAVVDCLGDQSAREVFAAVVGVAAVTVDRELGALAEVAF